MANLIHHFPEILTTCRFYIELKLDGSQEPVDAYFMECKGFKQSQAAVEACEVSPRQWGKAKSGQLVHTKLPGNVKTSNLTLRRGMTQSPTLWNWFESIQQGGWAKQLRDGSLTIYDQTGDPQTIFNFTGAWPMSYQVSDLSVSTTELAIEEMELAIESFTRQR
jgi:phage tail-like protein